MAKEMTREMIESMLGGSAPVAEGKEERQPSESQMKYYLDLCSKKGFPPSEEAMSYAEVDKAIKKMKEIPDRRPVSEKQKERITELCALMNMPTPDFDKLDGSFNGTASQLIQKLNDKKKTMVFPISEKQLALITQMQFCPEVEPTDYENFTTVEASEYIAKYKDGFYAWKKGRLSPEQFKLIETLTERQGSKLAYEAIIQFDAPTASKFIEQLEMELADKTLTETTLEPLFPERVGDKDASEELKDLVAKLYASIGQELEEEFFETMKWEGLKELIDFVKLFGVNVEAMFDKTECLDTNQKAYLLS